MYEVYRGQPQSAPEEHTFALRNFITWSSKIAADRAYWHALTIPGASIESSSQWARELMDEALGEIVKHVGWLHEQGLELVFRADEGNPPLRVAGLSLEKDSMGIVAHVATPYSAEPVALQIWDVGQLAVRSRY